MKRTFQYCAVKDSAVPAWVLQHVQQSGTSQQALLAPFLHIPDHVAEAQRPGATLKQTKAWLQVGIFP